MKLDFTLILRVEGEKISRVVGKKRVRGKRERKRAKERGMKIKRKTQGRIIETIRGNCKKIVGLEVRCEGEGKRGFFSECGEGVVRI
jgi:hypothetical protein